MRFYNRLTEALLRRPVELGLRPVADVVALREASMAPGEAAAVVPMLKRAAYPAGIARQAPRRFRGNVLPTVEHGLTGLIRVGQHSGVDVHHHLVALARGARIDPVV